MELVRGTPAPSAVTLGRDKHGIESAVVVVKSTYDMPRDGGELSLASVHAPLVDADTFTGEPGRSATLHESDFAPEKPMCDVLVLGSAHAPEGRPVPVVPVGMRVGSCSKSFEVVGPRYWTASLLDATPSSPTPFVSAPISYDTAYGGLELDPATGEPLAAYAPNPVGRGYLHRLAGRVLLGQPAPNAQEHRDPIKSPRKKYTPMALGPLGRNFGPRVPFAGTYDDAWMASRFPLLPLDFDVRYFQCAPPDQQIPFPRGGELVRLINLTPEPQPDLFLPDTSLDIEFTLADGTRHTVRSVVDTITLEPDARRVTLVHRASLRLRRGLHEVRQVVVGRMPPGWYRARALGKRFYPSLAELPRRAP